jgi:hypothetical protein
MERELWSREDLRNAILAAYYAGVASQPAPDTPGSRRYAEGFRAALSALALQFGLPALEPPTRKPSAGLQINGMEDAERRIVGG